MSNFLNSYPIFENNQVLTSSQLNQLVAYLDEQNRLTRAKLIGTGIACGFDLKFNNAVTPYELTIFQGMGVTSEGYLITEGDCVTRRYRPYTLPNGVRYVPFEDPFTTVQDVALWELLTDDAPTLPSDVINPLNVPTNFVNDKVVLLFLETIDVDLKSCLGKACDENGIDREFHLRKLIIGIKDLEKILARTCDQSTALFPSKYDLPEITMKRALFSSDSLTPNTKDYYNFSKTYVGALKSPAKPSATPIYTQVFKALSQSYIDFSPILEDQYNHINPFDPTIMPPAAWLSYLQGSSTGGPPYLGIQYFYDFIKDLILAYNEFRDAAFDLMSECCTDLDCFPKHLMLGTVIPIQSDKPSRYRHYWVSSTVFNNQKERLALVISLFQRMVLMTKKFNLPTINNPATVVPPESSLAVPIYITPSNEKRDPLSKRSIPYYYRIHEADASLGTLERSWNYTYIQKALFSKGLAPLAYGNQNFDQENDFGPVGSPLRYDLDPYNFLRIEGHLRGKYLPVVDAIEQMKKDFDLAFNVVALRLNGDSFDDIKKRCNFDDLRTQYSTLKVELSALLRTVFDRFGRYVEGDHAAVKPRPEFLQLLINDCAQSASDTGSVHQPQTGFFTTRTAGGVPSVKVPVYAPGRSIYEVTAKLDADMLNLLRSIDVLTAGLPFDMLDFRFGYTGTTPDSTPGFVQNYVSALQSAINVKVGYNQLIDLIIRNTRIRNTPELYMNLSVYMSDVLALLERFIRDPRINSLTILNYTFYYRINQLKANDMTVFSNFIKKHPGVEHKAGVKPGGTFIVVYPGNAVAVDPVKRDFAVNEVRNIKDLKTKVARINAQEVKSREDMEKVAQYQSTIINFTQVTTEIAIDAIPIQKFAIAADQVIADFSLPYLCCCDCECDELVPPTEYAQLGVPLIAPPYYAEYSLGDYAYGKDVDLGVRNVSAAEYVIDIIPMLQYDKTRYSKLRIRLSLINADGTKIVPSYSTMNTNNYPNEPNAAGGPRGHVSVVNAADGSSQVFSYTLNNRETFVGTDSFYYIFEVMNADNSQVLERSTPGKVTLSLLYRASVGGA